MEVIAMVKKAVILFVALVLLCGCACAEDNVWALCKTYVNLRERPSSNGQIVGYLDSGDGAETDGVVKGGWVHIISPSIETGDAWVNASYIVYDKPEWVGERLKVVSDGRVALRKTINGKRRAWAHNGDVLHVLWVSSEWSLTNRGYIKTEYLEVD